MKCGEFGRAALSCWCYGAVVTRLLILVSMLVLIVGCGDRSDGVLDQEAMAIKYDLSGRSDRLSNYHGNPDRWVEALTCWRIRVEGTASIDPPTLGPRRSMDDLSELMGRIPDLPKSYIDFLLAGGDGGPKSSIHQQPATVPGYWDGVDEHPFLPPGKVGWFREVLPDGLADWLIDGYEELDAPLDDRYFAYDGKGHYGDFRVSELPEMLLVGFERSGGYFLLNPVHRAADGEWEAVLLHHKFPGADRVRSFAHLVAAEYVNDLAEMGEPGGGSLYAFDGDWSKTCFAAILDMDW